MAFPDHHPELQPSAKRELHDTLKDMGIQKTSKKRSVFAILVIPLFAGAVLAMLAALLTPEPWRSLLVNISAGLLGSIVTVLYVDQMLRRREQSEWAAVSSHVRSQVTRLAIGTASGIRLALQMPPPSLDPDRVPDPEYIRVMMLSDIEERITHHVGQITNMNQEDWSKLANNLTGTMRDIERLLTLFSRHLDSAVVASVLEIAEKARSILGQYQTWPDMLGVPFDQMQPNNRGESMVPYFRAVHQIIIRDCEELLAICATVLRTIEGHFPS